MTETGSSGRHRVFDEWQAYKLIVFTILTTYGFKLAAAGGLAEFAICETQERIDEIRRRKEHFFSEAAYQMEVLQHRFVRVSFGDESAKDVPWQSAMSMPVRKTSGHIGNIVHGNVSILINLSHIMYGLRIT